MRIGIIGAGGVGGFYGALLARAGQDVHLLARGAHLAAIRERGLELRSGQFGTFTVQVPASDDPTALAGSDYLLLAVKTYDLDGSIQAAKAALGPHTAVLTLQNGVDAPDRVAAVIGPERVLVGSTGLEGTIVEPGVVGHLGSWHWLTVAELEGLPGERVQRLVGALKEADINASAAPDGRTSLWKKASFLVPVAALTAVCQTGIGPIRDLPETRSLLDSVASEVVAVAKARGSDVPRATFDAVPATMRASMARDFARGGPNELDALLGAVVRLGAESGVPTPSTSAIYAILKLRSRQAHAD